MPRRWVGYLLEPVDAASVGVFRIVFGSLVAIDALRFLGGGYVDEYFVAPRIHFTYLYLDGVQPLARPWMYAHMWTLATAALLLALGLAYRLAAIVLCGTYAYFFLLEQAIYQNHYYLILLFTGLLLWIPADRAYALDTLWRSPRPAVVPRWSVLILRFQLFVMYAYGAIAKLNADWLRGEPMYSLFTQADAAVPAIAHTVPPALLAYGIAYAGIACDVAIPLLLVWRRTVWLGFTLACAFHVLNGIFLNIGIFSYLAVGAITIFFAPDWPRRLRAWMTATPAPHPAPHGPAAPTGRTRVLLAALHVYVVLQLLVPLRHVLYPGPVNWTEEGHRFSWHMKLRSKRASMTMTATDPATGRQWQLDPAADLSHRQLDKLRTAPDILLQYVHAQRDRLRAAGVSDPVITVDWWCSLNGRAAQRLVDPTVNLAAVERSWRPASWILPLADPPAGRGRSPSDASEPPRAVLTGENGLREP